MRTHNRARRSSIRGSPTTTSHQIAQARLVDDDSVTLSFRVDGLEEIVWWVLGWSGTVEVVRPLELRQMVVEKLRQALILNELPGTP